MQSLAQMNAHPGRLSDKISVHVHPAPPQNITMYSSAASTSTAGGANENLLDDIYGNAAPSHTFCDALGSSGSGSGVGVGVGVGVGGPFLQLQSDPFLAPRDDGPRRRKRREKERAKNRKARSRSTSPSPYEEGDDFRRRVQTMSSMPAHDDEAFRRRVFSTPDRSSALHTPIASHLSDPMLHMTSQAATMLMPHPHHHHHTLSHSNPNIPAISRGQPPHTPSRSQQQQQQQQQQRRSTQVENVSQTAADDLTALFAVLGTSARSPKPAVVPMRSRQLPESFFGKPTTSYTSEHPDTVPNDTGIYYEEASPASLFQDDLDTHSSLLRKPGSSSTSATLNGQMKIDSLAHILSQPHQQTLPLLPHQQVDLDSTIGAATDLGLFHGQLEMFNDVQQYLDTELTMLHTDDQNTGNIFQDLALTFDV